MKKEETTIKVFADDTDNSEKPIEAENQDDMTTVVEIAEENGKGTYKLERPLQIDGETKDSIYYDLPSVTPFHIEKIVKEEERKNGYPFIQPMASTTIQIKIFSQASGIPTVILKSQLLNKDYMNVCNLVFSYFFG